MNSPRLLPYNNPENVDESRVPKGWRFLYADEKPHPKLLARVWLHSCFSISQNNWGWVKEYTYIVPVA